MAELRSFYAARTLKRGDHLLESMAIVFYGATRGGEVFAGIRAGMQALLLYEELTGQFQSAETRFKSLPVTLDATVPDDEMVFDLKGGDTVRLKGIS